MRDAAGAMFVPCMDSMSRSHLVILVQMCDLKLVMTVLQSKCSSHTHTDVTLVKVC